MSQEGVSAKELSRRSGVPDTTILRVLKGERIPSFDTYERILAGLGVVPVLDIRTLP